MLYPEGMTAIDRGASNTKQVGSKFSKNACCRFGTEQPPKFEIQEIMSNRLLYDRIYKKSAKCKMRNPRLNTVSFPQWICVENVKQPINTQHKNLGSRFILWDICYNRSCDLRLSTYKIKRIRMVAFGRQKISQLIPKQFRIPLLWFFADLNINQSCHFS